MNNSEQKQKKKLETRSRRHAPFRIVGVDRIQIHWHAYSSLLWRQVTRQSLTTPWGNLKTQGARIARNSGSLLLRGEQTVKILINTYIHRVAVGKTVLLEKKKTNRFLSQSRNSPNFMAHNGSSPCSQEPTNESSALLLNLFLKDKF